MQTLSQYISDYLNEEQERGNSEVTPELIAEAIDAYNGGAAGEIISDRIVIEVSDNRVTAVWCSNPETKATVLDWDIVQYNESMQALDEDDNEYQQMIKGLYLLDNRKCNYLAE